MNKLILRKEEVLTEYFDCDDLYQVVDRIKKQMEEKQQVVCSIRLNQREIAEQEELELSSFKLANLKILEVEYCPYNDFFVEFIDSTLQFILDLKNVSPHISESIYEHQLSRFSTLFQDFIESMDSLMNALSMLRYKGSREDLLTRWELAENRTSDVLQQILELYPKKDFVSLADVFDYEMLDVLEEWSSLLQTMKADGKTGQSQKSND